MKQWIVLICILCLLTGCSTPVTTAPSSTPESSTQNTDPQTDPPSTPTEPTGSTAPSITFTVYVPNAHWQELESYSVTIDQLDPQIVLQQLQDANVIFSEAAVLSATIDDNGMLTLDLNEAFLMQLCSLGSTGEGMLMSSLVNTFLSAYGCECMMVIAEGEIIHSGHVDYDFPMYGIIGNPEA